MITFYVGMTGLNTSIDEFMTEDEWNNTAPDDFPPNVNWEQVTVVSEQDVDKWVVAKNHHLCAAWTPNQSQDEREDNAVKMRLAAAEMDRLEAKVKV